MKCSRESEILHEIVHDTTRKSVKHELIRVVAQTISCSISCSIHFFFFLTVWWYEFVDQIFLIFQFGLKPIPEECWGEGWAHLQPQQLLVLEVVGIEKGDNQVDPHQQAQVEVTLPLLLVRAHKVDQQVQDLTTRTETKTLRIHVQKTYSTEKSEVLWTIMYCTFREEW